ncbi:MAG TPA: hypothetical protein VN782_04380 [Usitatibacter sp.]|nr:hypothetical protein [Usitatibacter sp.]
MGKSKAFAIVCVAISGILLATGPARHQIANAQLQSAVSACSAENAERARRLAALPRGQMYPAEQIAALTALVCDPYELRYLRTNIPPAPDAQVQLQLPINRSELAAALSANRATSNREKIRAGRIVDDVRQDRIVALADFAEAKTSSDVIAIAFTMALIGAAPIVISWVWYFLLRRISEIATAIRGRGQ